MPHNSCNQASPRRQKRGFTLIELVMVILLLAILAAIAIPNFIDFRTDAKNAATEGALGAFRAALAIATAGIALREDPTIGILPKYPTVTEMWGNTFISASPNSHPIMAEISYDYIMDPAQGIPKNPWTYTTLPVADFNSIYDCSTLTAKSQIISPPGDGRGWCYRQDEGIIWANSKNNGGPVYEDTY